MVKIRILKTIDKTNLLFGGSLYVLNDGSDALTFDISDISKIMTSFSFEDKINTIISEHKKSEEEQTTDEKKEEITEVFKNKDNGAEFILFPEFGIKGSDKLDFSSISVICLEITTGLNLGFFVDKLLCEEMFDGKGDEFEL